MKYQFERESEDNFCNIMVRHCLSGATVPYIAMHGGGPIFDIWHSYSTPEQGKIFRKWRERGGLKYRFSLYPKPQMSVDTETCCGINTVSLGCKPAAPMRDDYSNYIPSVNEVEEKEHPMYAQISTQEHPERDYASKRLRQIRDAKEQPLREFFNIDDLPSPKTFGQLKEYLAKGFLVIHPKYANMDDDKHIWGAMDYMTWRDPSRVADEAGYKAAKDAIEAAYRDAKDTIKMLSPEAGLEALKAFEAKTFH